MLPTLSLAQVSKSPWIKSPNEDINGKLHTAEWFDNLGTKTRVAHMCNAYSERELWVHSNLLVAGDPKLETRELHLQETFRGQLNHTNSTECLIRQVLAWLQ